MPLPDSTSIMFFSHNVFVEKHIYPSHSPISLPLLILAVSFFRLGLPHRYNDNDAPEFSKNQELPDWRCAAD